MNNKFDKKTGLEELKRTLLMMKYDSSKTLTENESKIGNVLLEQTNTMTDNDLIPIVDIMVKKLDLPSFAIGINQMNIILNTLNKLSGKCYLDDTKSPATLIPAINRLLELYTEDEHGDDLINDIEVIDTYTQPTGTEKLKKLILNKIQELKNTPCSTTQQQSTVPPCINTSEFEKQKRSDGNFQWVNKKTNIVFYGNYRCYDPKTKKTGTYKCGGSVTENRHHVNEQVTTIGNISITWDTPSGTKTNVAKPTYTVPQELTGKVKQFQDWLDRNHPGWHKKYNVLNQNIQKGYGKFGPNTNKSWGLYGKEFLAGKEEQTASSVTQTQNNQQAQASPVTPEQPTQITTERQQEIISNLRKRSLDNAYIYKGKTLSSNELSFITDYMTNKGYQLIKEKDKGYGEKYVFKKIR